MCGIVSVFDSCGVPDEPAMRRALGTLHHRGPDGAGLWFAPDRTVTLGHTRLAVIAPQSGAQPILSEDGQIAIVVNGEFYDFETIRSSLEDRGHRFRTNSDSEIALHLYEEHGVDCLRFLHGEFAFVLWDGRTRTLFAARDRFGIKPLCYASGRDRCLLASEAKALFGLGISAQWDHSTFFQIAGMQYPLGNDTLFAGVRQVPPGHYVLIDDRRGKVVSYWDLDRPANEERLSEDGLHEHSAELQRRLDAAVRRRLRADVPVCFHLSGGLDSSSIVALAARHLPTAPVCFTVGFEASGYDELEQTAEMARHVGADLRPVRVTQRDIVEHLSDAVYFSEGLAINGHLTAKYLLAKAIRAAGFKVVLSGEGADEILGGYAHFRRDLLIEAAGGDPSKLAALLADNADMAGIQLPEGDGLPLDAVRAALGFVPSFLEAKATLGLRMRRLLSRDFLAAFPGCDPFAIFLGSFDVAGRPRVEQSAYLWTKSALATYILRTLGDGTEMAHGVEGRLPFLDTAVVDFASRLPISLKIRDGVEKHLLREAMRSELPDAVYRRRKHPFTAPPLARFASSDSWAFVRDTLTDSLPPFFDSVAVRDLLDRLPTLPEREQTATDPVLMLTLTACLLARRFQLR